MHNNLTTLRNTRARLSSGQNNSRTRRQILNRIEQHGCNRSDNTRLAAAQPERKSRRRTLLEQVFGVKTYNDRGTGRYGEDVEADEKFDSKYGTYRTLCVRKTDGYYFPMSFSTVPERFDYDEEICKSMCPSSDVGLYVHRMPSQDSEDMISYRTSTAYVDEPFAFAYRKTHNPENKCRFSVAGINQGIEVAPTGIVDEPIINTDPVRIPNFRKDPADNPDDYDNQVARLTFKEAKNYLYESSRRNTIFADSEFTGGKKIRIVGPAFFPVQ
ncbi:MAG: DUF2865 domain-containing protein [Pseudomonadota bacterium]